MSDQGPLLEKWKVKTDFPPGYLENCLSTKSLKRKLNTSLSLSDKNLIRQSQATAEKRFKSMIKIDSMQTEPKCTTLQFASSSYKDKLCIHNSLLASEPQNLENRVLTKLLSSEGTLHFLGHDSKHLSPPEIIASSSYPRKNKVEPAQCSAVLSSGKEKRSWQKETKIEGKVQKKGETKKRKITENREVLIEKVENIPPPVYNISELNNIVADNIMLKQFTSSVKDTATLKHLQFRKDVNGMKLGLINAVSGSLICTPNFKYPKDKARIELMQMCEQVIMYDPEFILKVALYARRELNIRTTSNFLLAAAANIHNCRPFLRKYFNAAVMLPSDWIDVAEIYQAFWDKDLNFGSLPSALRRVMLTKFPQFDKYQLAKYNKQKSRKKKTKKNIQTGSSKDNSDLNEHDSSSDDDEDGSESRNYSDNSQEEKEKDDEDSETEEELIQKTFTLKQLIRKLHINNPVDHVMCLLGKRYPKSLNEFYQCCLPGIWEEEKAGKRMKLPIPETWETQVALHGNKAAVWESLIDHKNLPFMAMLRNLRNLIKAGVSQKYHNEVLKRLTDERSVINSKQFPFRFFSAYSALDSLDSDLRVDICMKFKKNTPWWEQKRKLKAKKKQQKLPYDTVLLTRYRKALDTAVKIATVHNVRPIRGRTIIFCNIGFSMYLVCTAAKGLGTRTMQEVSTLLGLMCKHSCEDSLLVVFNDEGYSTVSLKKGTILDNMQLVLKYPVTHKMTEKLTDGLPYKILSDALRDRTQIDNLIILSDGASSPQSEKGNLLGNFLKKFRILVNPNLLFVSVSFDGQFCTFDKQINPEHENDIYISGYSDQILRFIANRGDSGQLNHVEKIDQTYKLKSQPLVMLDSSSKSPEVTPPVPLPVVSPVPRWRTARVFISSTFRDMHGERDLLTRYIFPKLRTWAKNHFVNVYEVDLRWGITEEEARSNKALELCLTEVSKCNLFIGILGERQGWVPDRAAFPEGEKFDWIREYPQGASVTELEMHCAALANPTTAKDAAFFFFRDSSFENDVPKNLLAHFLAESEGSKARMKKLKEKICSSGLEVYENYPAKLGGLLDGKAIVTNLEEFGLRVFNCLQNAISKLYPEEPTALDELTHTRKLHQAFAESHQVRFVGRKLLLKQCLNKMTEMSYGIFLLVGKPGTGKSSLMATLIHQYIKSKFCSNSSTILNHIVGAAPGSTNILATLQRLCHELKRTFDLETEIPSEFKNVVGKFSYLLSLAAKQCLSTLTVFIDGLDMMEDTHLPHNMEWLPAHIPENVLFVMTVQQGERCHKAIQRRRNTEIQVSNLDIWDRADVVRKSLAIHRKTLDESPFNNQLKILLAKREASNPLFLKLACEELRVFGIFEQVSNKLKSLPQTVPTLLQDVLARLEADLGRDLLRMALCLLLCSKEGLLAEELYDLLSLHFVVKHENAPLAEFLKTDLLPENCIPKATFARLHHALLSFLNPTEMWTSHLCVSHTYIEAAVRLRYLSGASSGNLYFHKLLAAYFYQKADLRKDGTWIGTDTRAFSDLPHHLFASGNFKNLEAVLCNFHFIYGKCRLQLGSQLLEDFAGKSSKNRFLEREHTRFLSQERVHDYKTFVEKNLHILSSHPALTWQQAANEPTGTAPANEVQESMKTLLENRYMEWTNKPRERDSCLMTFSNFSKPVNCVAISPNNQYLACGSQDCSVRLYNLNTGKNLGSFHGHSDEVTDVCFVGADKLCSASADSTLSLWDVQHGHRIAVLKYHRKRVNSCCADPSGKFIASASWDCSLKIWESFHGREVCTLKDDRNRLNLIMATGKDDQNAGSADLLMSPINCVAFHPEDQKIVIGNWDASLKIWDILSKTRKAILHGHESSIQDVAYSSSGIHIASASLDGEVKLWFAAKGSQVASVAGHALPINRLLFTPFSHELVTVSSDKKIKVWSGHLGQLVHTLGGSELGPATSVSISPNGKAVAVGYHEGQVRVFGVSTGIQVFEVVVHVASVQCLKYSPDGQYIATGSDDCSVKVLDSVNGNCQSTLESHTKPVLSVDFGKRCLVSASEDVSCCVYEIQGKLAFAKNPSPVAVLSGHEAPVTCCTLNKEGKLLATGGRDMQVLIWDVQIVLLNGSSARPIQSFYACHADWITDCKWSNTCDYLVTSSNDFTLKVWSLASGLEKDKLTGHMSSVNSLAYSYGCILSACSDGSVKLWSHRGAEVTTLYGHRQRVNSCDIFVKIPNLEDHKSENSTWAQIMENSEVKARNRESDVKKKYVVAVTCSDDGTVKVWKPLMTNELKCMIGHTDRIIGAACSKQGQLCTSSLDNTVKLWSLQVSSHYTSSRHDAEITDITCSLNGDLALSSSRDGVVKLWSTENQGKPECEFSFQAHDSSVNAVCFVSQKGRKFATGSDDATIVFWDIDARNGKPIFRKSKTFQTDSPVLSLAWNREVRVQFEDVILSVEWNGNIKMWSYSKMKPLAVWKGIEPVNGHTDWILKLAYHSSFSNYILSAGCDEQLRVWNLKSTSSGKTQKTSLKTQISFSIKSDTVQPETPVEKRMANWVTSMAGHQQNIYVGDLYGQVTTIKRFASTDAQQESHKVHTAAVTAILIIADIILTGSKDGNIKVWTHNLEQIGQFFSAAPVTCMAEQHDNSRSGEKNVRLVAGDQLGNVSFLSWKNQSK